MNKKLSLFVKKYGLPKDVQGTCSLENIEKNKVSFLSNKDYIKFVKKNQNLILLTSKEMYEEVKHVNGNRYIIVDNPHQAFIQFHNAYHAAFCPNTTSNKKIKQGKNCIIDKTARFGNNVEIGANVKIYPYVTIGSNVKIGNDSVLFPMVSIYDNVRIGNNCTIDSGAVIGGEGFSTVCDKSQGAMRLLNIGRVEIGNYVEIGSNTCVDRASFMATIIRDRVKIDNLVHVAHNVFIDEDSRIAPLVCIAGGCRIGKRVWIGIGCTLRDHLSIGDDCQILMNAVLIDSVESNQRVGGFYAMPHKIWKAHIQDIKQKFG